MARLNEPPPPAPASANVVPPGTESVDAYHRDIGMRTKSKLVVQKPPADFEEVKRRFIRQNRELAKNNSSQSLRIRNLELEVSRLLADNLELRNQVLHLQNEVCNAQRQNANSAAQRVKQELQAKIAELSSLVDGIEDAQEAGSQYTTRERKPLEGNWRERQPLTELMRESQMPTIVEDKQYPRRTLGADEIHAIRLSDHSSNGSPDLGPPPVAHFDYEDPVKNASPLGNKMSPAKPASTSEEDLLPASLSVNLETRRKRKDGSSRLEIRRHSLLPQSPEKAEGEPPTILRTGAKRKLADRGENDKPIKPPSKGDFTFSRKTTGEETKTTDGKRTPAEAPELTAPASPKPARKVLSDKSVNMSPRKTVQTTGKPEKDNSDRPMPSKPAFAKDPAAGRRRRASSIPMPSPPREAPNTIELLPPPELASPIETDPKTPAALDLFSPTPSEPSAKPADGRGDTPPPGDISTLSTTTDGGTRPSRRARAAVNYAEPSLMAKMRRPDKKMVDAISGLQDSRRVISASGARRTSSLTREVVVKDEPVEEEGDAWKDLPVATGVAPGSPLRERSDHDNIQVMPVEDYQAASRDVQASASSATISALMRKRRPSSQRQPDMDVTAKKLEELDLYDFKESSSPGTDGSTGARPAHRRHSSVPKDIGGPQVDHVPSVGRSERAASRRRSMML
ncbi:hypothetical protein LTR37_002318 [Vermiconidia calcicola]|uniref:Uncharacterized protein n=1 Tax=Vermiconidia calcicola TaxID=1690605 RepID=A0ACC3NTP8_9PEZI|nr:hypothetical protein LTR37_002318 [Vermiconidia calcicola]